MYQPGGRPGGNRTPEIDFGEFSKRFRGAFDSVVQRFGRWGVGGIVLGIGAIIFFIWFIQGIYTIDPGEQGALRRVGKLCSAVIGPCGDNEGLVTSTGLHWWWPGPVGRRDVVRVTETRRMELGFRSAEGGAVVPNLTEALIITGDLNNVDAQMVVQYDIRNLAHYLFNVNDPGEPARGIAPGRPDGVTLRDATEAALRLVIGQRAIDDALTDKREQIEADTRVKLQEILNSYEAGINITNVRLQDVRAPDEVRDAFDDVLRARQEKDTKINLAEAYQNNIIPVAEGNAVRILEAAEAFKQERILKASGEAARFTSILNEYQKAREVTRQRLYLEAMEEILPGITKFIISPDAQALIVTGGQGGLTPVPFGPTPPSP